MNEGSWKVYIGLEIHIHLKTDSKMFCSCPARYGDEPNTHVCPVCLGYPGTLPQANERAFFLSYLIARALSCRLSRSMSFARKNYFYPDMPKNYQISQFHNPIGQEGVVELELDNTSSREIRVHDVHLEEDAGKMIHEGDLTLLDYNRAGYPLLEVVTEPDLRSGEETEKFLRAFQRVIRYLDVSDGNMDEGSMKCDANISLNRPGQGLGTKVEIKNMNSPRFVRQALNYEIERQMELLDSGTSIIQETRLWNENRDITENMREKEGTNDYRYFPEPDMPPFVPDKAFMERLEASLVELPLPRKRRLQTEYGLNPEQSEFIHKDLGMAVLFEETVQLGSEPGMVMAWLTSDIQKHLNSLHLNIQDTTLSSSRLDSLINLVNSGKINGKTAKKVLKEIFEKDEEPQNIVQANKWFLISDEAEIADIIGRVIKANPQVFSEEGAGGILGLKDKEKHWIMGQIMKESGGRVSPVIANRILEKQLNN